MCRLCDEPSDIFEYACCERCGAPICLDVKPDETPPEGLKLAVCLDPGWECIDCYVEQEAAA